MTNQEATEYFKNKLDLTRNLQKGQTDKSALAISSRNIEAYELAIAALEKQEPMKPMNICESELTSADGKAGYYGVCPICNNYLDSMWADEKYCSNCGQALKWSDGNDKQ